MGELNTVITIDDIEENRRKQNKKERVFRGLSISQDHMFLDLFVSQVELITVI